MKNRSYNPLYVPLKSRKNRCITATDSEWEEVVKQAQIADMTISRYVIERLIHPPEVDEPSTKKDTEKDDFPTSVQWQMAKDIRLLTELKRQEYQPEIWKKKSAHIKTAIDKYLEKKGRKTIHEKD